MAEGELAALFTDMWTEATGVSFKIGTKQRIYELAKVLEPEKPEGGMRKAIRADLDLVLEWAEIFSIEALNAENRGGLAKAAERSLKGGNLFLWEIDGEAVSMAAKVRPTTHTQSVSYVLTPKKHLAFSK